MSGFAGTLSMVRLGLRRNRILISAGVLLLVVLVAGSAKATEALHLQSATAAAEAVLVGPAIVALYGPMANMADMDSLAIFKTFLLGGIGLALLVFTVVRRNTRTEEEAGRTELLGAAVVGRYAQLAAAVLIATGVGLVTGLLSSLGLIGSGLGIKGAWAFGVGWMSIGLCATTITAVAAQLTATSRGCAGWALGVLGVGYLLRAVGDTATGPLAALTWLSPFGWAEKIGPYGANRFLIGLIPVMVSLMLLALAGVLLTRRDIGSGSIPATSGRARGARSFRSPLALAWSLQRGGLIGWVIGSALLGLVLGFVASSVAGLASGSSIQELLRNLGGNATSLSDAFLVTEMNFMAIAAAAYGISAALRLRTEEVDLHGEQILATAASRRSVLAAHSVVALAGSAVLMIIFGAVTAIGYGQQNSGLGSALTHLLPTALATIPAVWICVGLALAVVGAMPRFVHLVWALLAAFVTVGEFGSLLRLPTTLIGISPFRHGQIVPGGAANSPVLLTLIAIAALLLLAADIAFRRRDIV